MKISRPLKVVALVLLTASGALAQSRDRTPGRTPSSSHAATLAGGWNALASGRTEDAAMAADALLTQRPTDHAAIDLKIEALASGTPLRALDAYEGWLVKSRIEDVFLIGSVARGTLEEISASTDPVLQTQALQKLAQDGDPRSFERLQELMKSAPAATDLQLALAGNHNAAIRLLEPSEAGSVQPQMLAKALASAGPGAVPALRALLRHPAAPVRMEAALSLGKLGNPDAIADLKPLVSDPEVRSFAAVALTRLGDADAETLVQELLQSEAFDVRLLGAQAYEGKGPGPWSEALMPALRDPNGLTRIRAAELLAPVAPDMARAVLIEAAKDPNPVIRADVARVFEQSSALASSAAQVAPGDAQANELPATVSVLRRLLRDTDLSIRIHAAGAILALARGRG